MNLFLYQIKQAYLSLKQKPGFVFSVVSTMGITLGALLCVLTLAYVMLFKPLPYPEQERLYRVDHHIADTSGKVLDREYFYPGLLHLYKNEKVFGSSALIGYGNDILTSRSNQPLFSTGYVTPEWFVLLGAKLTLGRAFEQTENLNSYNPVAIISHEIWVSDYAKDENILTKKITLSGVSFSIIGVLHESFIEPEINKIGLKTNIWLPWDYNLQQGMKDNWGSPVSNISFVGKLNKEFSIEQAEQIISPLVNSTWQDNVRDMTFFNGWQVNMKLRSFKKVILATSENTVYMLLVSVLGLVIISCTNIANLFIANTADKKRKLAIYAAVGAKKSQLVSTLIAESLLLMMLAIFLALLISAIGFQIFQHYLFNVFPRIAELNMSVFTIALSIILIPFSSLIFALLSAKTINYHSLNNLLQVSGKGTGIQVTKKLRTILIISQVAITTLLVFVNSSLFVGAVNTIQTPSGMNIDNTLYLTLSTPESSSALKPKMDELAKQLSQLPQVHSVSLSVSPLTNFGSNVLTALDTNQQFIPQSKVIDHKYFQMIKQQLLAGENFVEGTSQGINRKIIVNDVFAAQLAVSGDVLGRRFKVGGGDVEVTVIAVVKGVQIPGENTVPARFYLTPSNVTANMLIHVKGQQVLSRDNVVSLIKDINNRWAVLDLESLHDNKINRLFKEITTAITTAGLTLLTLLLASIGLYGILSYSSQIRRFEIGTRMAIGAKGKEIVTLVLKDNAGALFIGVAVSVLILLGLYLGFSEQLTAYINSALIPLFIATLILISLVSFFACYLPLRQYIKQPVMHSLRGSE